MGRIINTHYPEIVKNLRGLEGAFDGELQCEDFITTMKRNRTENPIRIRNYADNQPATFYIFDLLSENMVLRDRLDLLNRKLTPREHIKLLSHTSDLRGLWKRAVKEKWEGIVIKDPDSKYLHRRSDQWLKIKVFHSREVVLVTYRDNDKGLMALTEDGISVQVWGYHANEVRTSIDLLGFCHAEISYFTEGAKGILRNVFLTKISSKGQSLPTLKKSA